MRPFFKRNSPLIVQEIASINIGEYYTWANINSDTATVSTYIMDDNFLNITTIFLTLLLQITLHNRNQGRITLQQNKESRQIKSLQNVYYSSSVKLILICRKGGMVVSEINIIIYKWKYPPPLPILGGEIQLMLLQQRVYITESK